MNIRETLFPDKNGVLQIGGISVCDLAKKYGTPLYVFDPSCLFAVTKR